MTTDAELVAVAAEYEYVPKVLTCQRCHRSIPQQVGYYYDRDGNLWHRECLDESDRPRTALAVWAVSPHSVPPPEPFDGLEVETPPADLAALRALLAIALKGRCTVPEVGRPAVAVEVGSWVGRTALALAGAIDELAGGNGAVFCVDTWQGTPGGDPTGVLAAQHGPAKVFGTFCRNVQRRLFRSVFPCKGTSAEWAAVWPLLPYGLADLVFIDADHSYEAALADIRAWLPHVRKGGIICGHDLGVFPGVNQAVQEVFGAVHTAGHCLWWKQV